MFMKENELRKELVPILNHKLHQFYNYSGCFEKNLFNLAINDYDKVTR